MKPEQAVPIGGIHLQRTNVERLLYSDRPLPHETRIKNYYVIRANGASIGAKAIVYSLGGDNFHGRDAARALLRLGIPVHAKRRYPTTDSPALKPYREAGLLIFDDEDELEQQGGLDFVGTEGALSQRFGSYYERSRRLRNLAIQIHGVTCKVCGFNFAAEYGELGAGYIEVHHLKPLSSVRDEHEVNARTDMTVVCSNCHRMLHRRNGDCLSVQELVRQRTRTQRHVSR